ncbi:MAG: ABC transporter ATP-binding protein [Isosphaeraceae bacterium]
MPSAVRVENLGKRYRVGGDSQVSGYRTLRESLVSVPASLMQRMRNAQHGGGTKDFWALTDINLEVQSGEVLGIIGRNGAGKSTLLKILSRITKPTVGQAEIRGRVGSLLEVGTGFHPELTGRENVFLSGSILGMRRREITARFDEIVEFSGIERFLETPVKRYSSGMYVRLAFAVAAHLEPEILIVDEVLAVGDVEFQRKCIDKLREVASGGGRTVLFVSHHLASVLSLCTRAVELRTGRVVADGSPAEVVEGYLAALKSYSTPDLALRTDRKGTGRVRMTRVTVSAEGQGSLTPGCVARIEIEMDRQCHELMVAFTIYNAMGHGIAHFRTTEWSRRDGFADGNVAVCEVEGLNLVPGRYYMNASVFSDGEMTDWVEMVAQFEVHEGLVNDRPIRAVTQIASAFFDHRWTLPRPA